MSDIEKLREFAEFMESSGWQGFGEYIALCRTVAGEIERLEQFVSDLHSGMYINCVYCGHRYGPREDTPVAMADVLKEHVEKCPKHPLSKARAEIERLRCLLTPCMHDTDIEDARYPRTANDLLSLLSAYIVDLMPEPIPGDEYFCAWERLARPVIEPMIKEIERLRNENAQLVKLLSEWITESDAGMIDGVNLGLMVSSEELLEALESRDSGEGK